MLKSENSLSVLCATNGSSFRNLRKLFEQEIAEQTEIGAYLLKLYAAGTQTLSFLSSLLFNLIGSYWLRPKAASVNRRAQMRNQWNSGDLG